MTRSRDLSCGMSRGVRLTALLSCVVEAGFLLIAKSRSRRSVQPKYSDFNQMGEISVINPIIIDEYLFNFAKHSMEIRYLKWNAIDKTLLSCSFNESLKLNRDMGFSFHLK